jgi:hypothetical protein
VTNTRMQTSEPLHRSFLKNSRGDMLATSMPNDKPADLPPSRPGSPRSWTQADVDAWEEQEYWEAQEEQRLLDEEELDAGRREEAIREMEEWFHENFEDPQNETPYDQEDGDYQYIWGGPFDAAVMLGDQFGHQYDQKWIDEVVERVQRSGTYEWAPTPSGNFYERPEEEDLSATSVETRLEISARIVARLDELDRHLDALTPAAPSIGHNNPPDGIGLPPYSDPAREEIKQASAVAREQVTSDNPDTNQLKASESTFRKYGASILQWVGQKLDLAVDESIKAGVKAMAWGTVASLLLGLADDIAAFLQTFLPF